MYSLVFEPLYISKQVLEYNFVENEKEKHYTKLREMTFDSFVGQSRHLRRIKLAIRTAQITGVLQHMMFVSEAGSGKTALASCIAKELGCTAIQVVGSMLTSMDSLSEFIDDISPGGILFVDEAHDIPKGSISGLLKLTEDWIFYTGSGSRLIKPFSCIMATNKSGDLDEALLSRLGIPIEFDPYTVDDMAEIAKIRFKELGIDKVSEKVLTYIGERSRSNPRFCGWLVKECYGVSIANDSSLSIELAQDTCDMLGIFNYGLNQKDIELLKQLMIEPMSLTSCCAFLKMNMQTYTNLHEGFLSRQGYVAISSRGRTITKKGISTLQSMGITS